MLKIKYQILADYDNTAFNTKIGVAENKIPDVSRLANETAFNKSPEVSGLVTNTVFNIKIGEIHSC